MEAGPPAYSSHLEGIDHVNWAPGGKGSSPVQLTAGACQEERDSSGPVLPSVTGTPAGEAAGHCSSRGDLGHGVKGEGKRKAAQSEAPGTSALEGHTQDRGPGKGVLTRWVGAGCACSPGGRTGVAVGKGSLRNTKWTIINIKRSCQSHTEKTPIVHHCVGPYLWGTGGGHTEKQKGAGESHSTSQGAVPEGRRGNLWLPRACASPQRGGPLASWNGPWHEVAYQAWAAQSPSYEETCSGLEKTLQSSSQIRVS